MTDQDIKKIARFLSEKKKLDKNTTDKILKGLSRQDLTRLRRILERYVAQNSVIVSSEKPLSKTFQESLRQKFKNKEVVFEQDDSINAGIKVSINDTIIDLSIKNYIDNTIDALKAKN